jgi:hypothetical protein
VTTVCVTVKQREFAAFLLRSKEPERCEVIQGRYNPATGMVLPGLGEVSECSDSEAQNTWNIPIEISGLVRGNYSYRASRQGHGDNVVCGLEGNNAPDCLRLLDSGASQLLECDFARGSCTQQPLPRGGCLAYIARTLAAELHGLLSEFRRKRAALHLIGAGNEYHLKDITQLLKETEEPVLALFHGDELAALRDSVRLTFQRVRSRVSDFETPHDGNDSGVMARGWIIPASLTSEAGDHQNVLRSIVDPLLDVIDRLLSRLTGVSDEHDYTTLPLRNQQAGAGCDVSYAAGRISQRRARRGNHCRDQEPRARPIYLLYRRKRISPCSVRLGREPGR